MVTRIFRALVHSQHRKNFEKAFSEISIPLVKSQVGLISVEIGHLMSNGELEYVMLSKWTDIVALKNFAGINWQAAVIPKGMEKYIDKCWVHHYELL